MFTLMSGSDLECHLLVHFLFCKPHLTPGGSGVLADPARIDEEFRKAWIPYFCRSGQREAIFEKFAQEFGSCPVVALDW